MIAQHSCWQDPRNDKRTRAWELGCAVLVLLATTLSGCSTMSVRSVNHANGMIEIDASAVVGDLTLTPNEDALTRAGEACRLIGSGLTPMLVRARQLPRQGDRRWIRYAFQCTPETP